MCARDGIMIIITHPTVQYQPRRTGVGETWAQAGEWRQLVSWTADMERADRDHALRWASPMSWATRNYLSADAALYTCAVLVRSCYSSCGPPPAL
mmetsp:Transcript_8828/g.21486  ORF Transcript_8828/g.21486 Transcript_8828/m.21486 type:complete len:95 (-) Transcript_8828:458-742(-)